LFAFTTEAQRAQRKNSIFLVCREVPTNKKVQSARALSGGRAEQFIENRHLPILDRDMRFLCGLRASSEPLSERVVSRSA
jgi:hypothetical protein